MVLQPPFCGVCPDIGHVELALSEVAVDLLPGHGLVFPDRQAVDA